jgi:hypothetical protein
LKNLIPITQKACQHERYFISIAPAFFNNNLYLVYNDKPNGHTQNKFGTTVLLDDVCQQTIVQIDMRGSMHKEKLENKLKLQRVMPVMSRTTSSGLLLVQRNANKRCFQYLEF